MDKNNYRKNLKNQDVKKRIRPVLLVENISQSFGRSHYKKSKNNNHEVSDEEKILLTLIANVIVEIIIMEEL